MNLMPFLVILLFSILFVYKNTYLEKIVIWYIPLKQILCLFIFPAIFILLISFLIQNILQRGLVTNQLIPRLWLLVVLELFILLTYGGIAIHTVTKTLADKYLRNLKTDLATLNSYFHLIFSHNLIYIGSIGIITCVASLDLHHIQTISSSPIWLNIIQGIIVGLIIAISMLHYTQSRDKYSGRFDDLKIVLIFLLICIIFLFSLAYLLSVDIRKYQIFILAISTLLFLGFSFLSLTLRKKFLKYK